jgi:hypothetical protein
VRVPGEGSFCVQLQVSVSIGRVRELRWRKRAAVSPTQLR